MLDKVRHVLIETMERLDVLNEKIDDLDKNERNMTREVYEVANRELSDDISLTVEFLDKKFTFLDKQLDELNQGESDMTREDYDIAWDICDNAYAILIDYQTELAQKQAEYTRKLLQGYSAQLEDIEFESSEGSAMRNAVKDLKDIIWGGIKKGATYAWDNKEKLYDSLMEKGQQVQDDLLMDKSRAEDAVERDSTQKIMNNVQKLLNKHRNGEVLSTYEKYYMQAAKRKLGI